MGTLVGCGIVGTIFIGLIATVIIYALLCISDDYIGWGENVCVFLVCATIIFAFFAGGYLWNELISNRDEYIKQINDTDADTVQEGEVTNEATIEVDSDTVETTEDVPDVNTVAPDMELVKPDNEPVDSVDLYQTRSYHTELFSDGTDYYLLVSVPNGDYPYKLSSNEYLDMVTGENIESYIVVIDVNGTPDNYMDDSILTLYPASGRG